MPTHSPTDKNVITEIVEKLKSMSLDKKEGQLVTRYIKNWADITEIKGCSTLQTLYQVDSESFRNAQLFIYPSVVVY